MASAHDDDEPPELNDYSDEDTEPDIQAILDRGYQQLDGFVEWLEQALAVDTRTAQQDCFNAETFVDYMANRHRKAVADVNEFELRWFVFSHYIRKTMADREVQERLPDSLLRFFTFLESTEGLELPEWAAATLDDHLFYAQRLQDFQGLASGDEAEWKSGFREWCDELANDLDTRCLWLPDDMGEGMTWGELMGWKEATLRDDANRVWQEERAALLADGLSYEAARDRLGVSYLLWLDTPQERLDGESPRQTILAERAEQRLEVNEDEDEETDI
ncbi:MAG TPA: hypothetical protein VKT77_14715 [Chthonomonadaceae bacterium]|nr:hypothetical protein [Chthonomonadaceae bacterium]